MPRGNPDLKNKGRKYTKENQPDPAAKSAGWRRKKQGQTLVKAMLAQPFIGHGRADATLRKMMADYMGIPEGEITVEMVMVFRQVQKGVKDSSTTAFRAVMERAFGLPKQELDVSTKGEKLPSPSSVNIIVQDDRTRQAMLNIKPRPADGE